MAPGPICGHAQKCRPVMVRFSNSTSRIPRRPKQCWQIKLFSTAWVKFPCTPTIESRWRQVVRGCAPAHARWSEIRKRWWRKGRGQAVTCINSMKYPRWGGGREGADARSGKVCKCEGKFPSSVRCPTKHQQNILSRWFWKRFSSLQLWKNEHQQYRHRSLLGVFTNIPLKTCTNSEKKLTTGLTNLIWFPEECGVMTKQSGVVL